MKKIVQLKRILTAASEQWEGTLETGESLFACKWLGFAVIELDGVQVHAEVAPDVYPVLVRQFQMVRSVVESINLEPVPSPSSEAEER